MKSAGNKKLNPLLFPFLIFLHFSGVVVIYRKSLHVMWRHSLVDPSLCLMLNSSTMDYKYLIMLSHFQPCPNQI